jgi:hypothetical protein
MIKPPNKLKDYCIVCNEVARRRDLSARAKGIYYYLATLPSDWRLNQKQLNCNFTEGVKAQRTAFKELIEKDYVKRTPKMNEKGLFDGHDYEVLWSSKTELAEKDVAQKGQVPNSQLLNTNRLNIKELNKKESIKEKNEHSANNFLFNLYPQLDDPDFKEAFIFFISYIEKKLGKPVSQNQKEKYLLKAQKMLDNKSLFEVIGRTYQDIAEDRKIHSLEYGK